MLARAEGVGEETWYRGRHKGLHPPSIRISRGRKQCWLGRCVHGETVGKIGTVDRVSDSDGGGIRVVMGKYSWWYPHFVLKCEGRVLYDVKHSG